ncbi:MAG: succinylglutamate desuccinylase/aspartoacylase family protein [Patescibacteria group bacterium]|jgi:hypothetical protein
MKNTTLFIGGTHGDEPIGVRVLEELSKERLDFDWLIGNEPALQQNTREFEGNLNRSAPGDKNSSLYAPRRAAEIIEIAKNYQYTIDLHGTATPSGIFLIITNPKEENLRLASWLSVSRVVIWPSFSPELKGPLSEYFSCGLEIECGSKDDPRTARQLKEILKKFLNNEQPEQKQKIFEVYGSLKNSEHRKLEDFQLTTTAGETFYPLLVGAYPGLVCYKMRRLK